MFFLYLWFWWCSGVFVTCHPLSGYAHFRLQMSKESTQTNVAITNGKYLTSWTIILWKLINARFGFDFFLVLWTSMHQCQNLYIKVKGVVGVLRSCILENQPHVQRIVQEFGYLHRELWNINMLFKLEMEMCSTT